MKKHVSSKPRYYSSDPEATRSGGKIVFPKELLDMYDELPSHKDELKKEYVASLSEEDRAKYTKASEVARAFQKKYSFTIDGKKYVPFTFNFKSSHWSVTWDKEWHEKALKSPELSEKIKDLIKTISQLAPRVKDKAGNDVVLTDKTETGSEPVYKTAFVADKTFERK